MTYKAVGRSIINYAAPVSSTNLRDTDYINIQYMQNEALRISTECHKMSSVDHLHAEANMLKIKEHSELLSAQYLARCLETENVNFSINTREPPKRMMKEPLFTRHRSAVEPLMIAKDRKTALQAIHTMAVNQAVTSLGRNVVLDDRPPAINISENVFTWKERTTLSQLRFGHCKLLGSYKSRISKDVSLYVCANCGKTPHDVKHLFNCSAHPTTMTPSDLWNRPVDAIRKLSHLEVGILDGDGPH